MTDKELLGDSDEDDVQSPLEDQNAKLKRKDAQIQQLQNREKFLNDSLHHLEDELAKAKQDVNTAQTESTKSHRSRRRANWENRQNEEHIKEGDDRYIALVKDYEKLKHSLSSQKGMFDKAKMEITGLKAELEQARRENLELEKKYTGMKKNFETEKSRLQKANEDLHQEAEARRELIGKMMKDLVGKPTLEDTKNTWHQTRGLSEEIGAIKPRSENSKANKSSEKAEQMTPPQPLPPHLRIPGSHTPSKDSKATIPQPVRSDSKPGSNILSKDFKAMAPQPVHADSKPGSNTLSKDFKATAPQLVRAGPKPKQQLSRAERRAQDKPRKGLALGTWSDGLAQIASKDEAEIQKYKEQEAARLEEEARTGIRYEPQLPSMIETWRVVKVNETTGKRNIESAVKGTTNFSKVKESKVVEPSAKAERPVTTIKTDNVSVQSRAVEPTDQIKRPVVRIPNERHTDLNMESEQIEQVMSEDPEAMKPNEEAERPLTSPDHAISEDADPSEASQHVERTPRPNTSDEGVLPDFRSSGAGSDDDLYTASDVGENLEMKRVRRSEDSGFQTDPVMVKRVGGTEDGGCQTDPVLVRWVGSTEDGGTQTEAVEVRTVRATREQGHQTDPAKMVDRPAGPDELEGVIERPISPGWFSFSEKTIFWIFAILYGVTFLWMLWSGSRAIKERTMLLTANDIRRQAVIGLRGAWYEGKPAGWVWNGGIAHKLCQQYAPSSHCGGPFRNFAATRATYLPTPVLRELWKEKTTVVW